MAYWLVKTEPQLFGWAEQVAHVVEPWTGVRSYAARNHLAAMRHGDRALFYHSGAERAVVGVVELAREAYQDPTATADQAKRAWVCVDLRTLAAMPRPVTLAQMKADPALDDLPLLRQSRLSVAPVSDLHWWHICKLGGWAETT